MKAIVASGVEPLRVLFIVESFPRLSETFIVQLVLECQRQGCDVTVLSLQPGEDAAQTKELHDSDVLDRVLCLDISLGRVGRVLGAISAALRLLGSGRNPLEFVRVRSHGRAVGALRGLQTAGKLSLREPLGHFDVVHAHFGKNGVLAHQLIDADILSGPLLVSFHGQDVTAYPQRFGRDVYKQLFGRAALLTAPSRYAAERLVTLGAGENKIRVIPSPFDTENFQARFRTTRHEGPVRLLTVGRLVEKKGTADALRAIALLKHRHAVDVHLEIVGDGPLRESLIRLAKELDIRESVSFSGALMPAEVSNAFDGSDVFLLPSVTGADGDHEGLPVVLLEAQASGLPVVATRHGGIPEGVIEGESAILVDEGDPDQLAMAIRQLISNPYLIREMGRAGHEYVQQHFSRDHIGSEIVKLYRQMST